MPEDLVEGADVDAVAAYVATVVTDLQAKVALPAGAGGDDLKLLFESNCGSRHVRRRRNERDDRPEPRSSEAGAAAGDHADHERRRRDAAVQEGRPTEQQQIRAARCIRHGELFA